MRNVFVDPGTIIKGHYNSGTREYVVLENYSHYVLCERVAPGGRYLKCFQKSDILHHTIPSEEYNL